MSPDTLPARSWTVFNIVGFQAVWLVCVIGAGRGHWWPGLAAAAVFALATLGLGADRGRDLRTLAIALPAGFAIDSILAQSQYLRFASPYPLAGLAPLWIMALWLGFALTLNHSLKGIYAKALPTFLFGLLGAPLAYGIASLRFDAMSVPSDRLVCVALVGAVWGLGLSLIRWIDLSHLFRKGPIA